MAAAREALVDDLALSPDEKEALVGALPDLIAETPRTAVVVERFKRLGPKMAAGTRRVAGKILVGIVVDVAKEVFYDWTGMKPPHPPGRNR